MKDDDVNSEAILYSSDRGLLQTVEERVKESINGGVLRAVIGIAKDVALHAYKDGFNRGMAAGAEEERMKTATDTTATPMETLIAEAKGDNIEERIRSARSAGWRQGYREGFKDGAESILHPPKPTEDKSQLHLEQRSVNEGGA